MFFDDAHLILPGLWLGNGKASMNDEFLKKNSITVVFNCTKDLPFHHSIKKRYRVPVNDNLKQEEIRNMELWSFEIIYKLSKEHKKNNVLVHCYAGMQRSAAVVAMYLIATQRMKKDDAIQYIRDKRSIAFRPYVNFDKSIQGFQDAYEKEVLPKLLD